MLTIKVPISFFMSGKVIRNHAIDYLPKNTYNTCKSDHKYSHSLNEISPSELTTLPPRATDYLTKIPTPDMKSPLLSH